MLIGSGTLVVGKVLGTLSSKLLDDPFVSKTDGIGTKTKINSTTFKIVENQDTLSFYDESGTKVLEIDNEA